MTCNLGACAGGCGRGFVGILTTCIFGFGFSFPVGSLGGSMGDFFCWGYVGTFFGPMSKNLMEGTDCVNLLVTHLN